MMKRILTCYALAGCLSIGALIVASPLGAQEIDSLPQRVWMSDSRESPPLAIPLREAITRDGSARRLGLEAAGSAQRARGPDPTWIDTGDRANRFALRGAVIGAVTGLVAFTATKGMGCLDDRDPETGLEIDASQKGNCIFRTSLPIYVGSGALGGGIVGWFLDRLTR